MGGGVRVPGTLFTQYRLDVIAVLFYLETRSSACLTSMGKIRENIFGSNIKLLTMIKTTFMSPNVVPQSSFVLVINSK